MVERPNRDDLDYALGIFRDAMRPFIVQALTCVKGTTVRECIEGARLHERQKESFRQLLDEGVDVKKAAEDAIDISDFRLFIANYWGDAFGIALGWDENIWVQLRRIVDARDLVAHPLSRDIELNQVLKWLANIVYVLEKVNKPQAIQDVEAIRKNLRKKKSFEGRADV